MTTVFNSSFNLLVVYLLLKVDSTLTITTALLSADSVLFGSEILQIMMIKDLLKLIS